MFAEIVRVCALPVAWTASSIRSMQRPYRFLILLKWQSYGKYKSDTVFKTS